MITSHDAVLRTAYASALTRAFEDGRRILFSLPSYHMFGYVEGLLSVFYVGGAIIPLTGVQRRTILRGHRTPPRDGHPLRAHHGRRHGGEPVEVGLRPVLPEGDALCGSAPAPIWLWTQIAEDFDVHEIVTGYGMTECGGAMTLTRPEDPLHLTTETVGRPKMAGAASVPGSDELVVYKSVDPVTGADVGTDREGELVSSGPTVMQGFWNQPEQTAAALRGEWLHSGDLGVVRSDGYLQVTGRSKELYKSGGELVMPKEIEDLLARHDDISQVFAIGLVDDRWGEIGCVIVVLAPGAAMTEVRSPDAVPGELGQVQGAQAGGVRRRRRPAEDADGQGAEVQARRVGGALSVRPPLPARPLSWAICSTRSACAGARGSAIRQLTPADR